MDSGWVAALASIASTLVVGVAALRQITHFRNANDIAAICGSST